MLHWVLRFEQHFSKMQKFNNFLWKSSLQTPGCSMKVPSPALPSFKPYSHAQVQQATQRTQTTKRQGGGTCSGRSIPTFQNFQVWGSIQHELFQCGASSVLLAFLSREICCWIILHDHHLLTKSSYLDVGRWNRKKVCTKLQMWKWRPLPQTLCINIGLAHRRILLWYFSLRRALDSQSGSLKH